MRRIFLVSLLALLSIQLSAQNFNDFLVASEEDARLLLTSYSEPAVTALGYGFANGWYNTAETHKSGGFDLTVTGNAVFWPSDATSFNPRAIGLTGVSNIPNRLETVFGPGELDESLTISYQSTDPTTGVRYSVDEDIEAPQGIGSDIESIGGFEALPVPMVQLGVGIVKNTDLKLRFTPSINSGDLNFQMFGGGIMHDITQWIPGMKQVPLQISVLLGYSNIKASYDLENTDFIAGSDQVSEFNISSWTYQVLVSKNLSIFTFYGGIGGNSGSSSFDMLGRYQYNAVNVDTGEQYVRTLVDPLTIDSDFSSFRATAGFRLKLAIITIHADYTIQNYNILSVGLGLTVR